MPPDRRTPTHNQTVWLDQQGRLDMGEDLTEGGDFRGL
jgi:hypothetical protein